MEIGKENTGIYPYYPHEWGHEPVQWVFSSNTPTILKFKGEVNRIEDLPTTTTVGNAYFIAHDGILVVRVSNGWHHFD